VDGVSPYPRWSLDGVMKDSVLCPRKQTADMAAELSMWTALYAHYQGGHLWRGGGVSRQPALYMRVMRLIDGVVKESKGA
jgi:hypothetical protein